MLESIKAMFREKTTLLDRIVSVIVIGTFVLYTVLFLIIIIFKIITCKCPPEEWLKWTGYAFLIFLLIMVSTYLSYFVTYSIIFAVYDVIKKMGEK